MRTLQVSEIFYSIQGEGVSCGRATAFIRLGGCTLGCQWCDTKYTWRGGPLWEEQRILDTVKGFPARRVVVTGGEPFEQNITSLLHALRATGFTIEIETAGFAPLAHVQCATLAHQLNVSPKLAHSGVPYERRINIPVLHFLRDTGRAYFKFVVDQPADMSEVDTLAATLSLAPERVLLMRRPSQQMKCSANPSGWSRPARAAATATRPVSTSCCGAPSVECKPV